MALPFDSRIVAAMARRTFRQTVESPIAYVVAIFFYGFVGGIFGINYFQMNQASVTGLSQIAPWILWFVIPALTMSLISEELRSGTYEVLSTLPLRDGEIVLGKFFGFGLLCFVLVAGLAFYPIIVSFTSQPQLGFDWGGTFGVLVGLLLMCLTYGAIGLFASSLTRNQVVALIIGMIFCTFFFFMGQLSEFFPGPLARVAEFLGISSHLDALSRGVWDLRDLLYFGSLIFGFLYFTVQRLSTRRF